MNKKKNIEILIMSIIEYLNNFKKNTDKMQTHLSLTNGKYNVSDEYYDEFYDRYYKNMKNENAVKMYLVEKISDAKFKFFLDIDNGISDESIDKILKKINSVILTYLNMELMKKSDDSKGLYNLEYIVSKREKDNLYKYHINYPNIIVNTSIALAIMGKIKEKLTEEELKMKIDGSVYKTGLRLIGSYKPNEEVCYRIYDLYTKKYKELTYELFKKCIIRCKNDVKLTEWKDLILETELKQNTRVSIINSGIKNKQIENQLYDLLKEMKERYSKELVKYSLNKTNIYSTKGHINTSTVFCYYISIREKYCPFKCREHVRITSPIYLEINIKGIFVKCYDEECTGMKYPMEGLKLPDNMEETYFELYKSMTDLYWNMDVVLTSNLRTYLEQSLNGTHYKIANAIFNLYKERFRVDDIKNSEWYMFTNGKWAKTGCKLNILISEELPKYYKSLKIVSEQIDDEVSNDVIDEENKLEKKNKETAKTNSRNQQIDKIILNLENLPFKECIIKQLTHLFKDYDPYFIKKLDENPYLMGFENGVYDFEKCEFRNGKTTDYITYTTNFDYIEYDESNEIVKEIYNFLSKIITNNNVRTYLLKVLGKALEGKPDEKFFIFTGVSGANGKSTLIHFMEMILNDYMISSDISLLTNKRNNSSNASPDLIRMKGVRMIAFQEPETNDKLRTGLLKQLSGNDSIIARALYKDPISFKMQSTLFLCCNDLPSITSQDGGTWRRIRVIDFSSRFVENPKNPNEFKIDNLLKLKMKKWKPYFMSILIYYHKLYKKEGIIEPNEVLSATNRYKNDNDKFNEYFDNCLKSDLESILTFKEIYTSMTQWWLNNNNQQRIPDIKEFKRSLKLKYGNEKEDKNNLVTGFQVSFVEDKRENNILDREDDY